VKDPIFSVAIIQPVSAYFGAPFDQLQHHPIEAA
jgi:hypothetical protein